MIVSSMAGRGKKYPTDPQAHPGHPFSLLTLIQTPQKAGRGGRSPERGAEYPAGGGTGVEGAGLAGEVELYRLHSYQSQPADLSLHPDPAHQFLPGPEHGPALLYPTLPRPAPPPLAHHHPFDTFYPEGAGGEFPGPGAEPSLTAVPGLPEQYTDSAYPDYYTTRLGFPFETGITEPARPEDRAIFDFQPGCGIKADLSESFRYEGGGYGGPLLPPPLHPSPAVLLHIKYVMESVCESMCFTDITLVARDDTLRAHRSILSAHSSFLACLLSSLATQDTQDEPVLFFPSYSSLYVRQEYFHT